MITWEDYKKQAKKHNKLVKEDVEEMELLAHIIAPLVSTRKNKGYSQRELAEICDLPQSSIARIEAGVVSPKIDTLLKILKPLGLTLTVSKL